MVNVIQRDLESGFTAHNPPIKTWPRPGGGSRLLKGGGALGRDRGRRTFVQILDPSMTLFGLICKTNLIMDLCFAVQTKLQNWGGGQGHCCPPHRYAPGHASTNLVGVGGAVFVQDYLSDTTYLLLNR